MRSRRNVRLGFVAVGAVTVIVVVLLILLRNSEANRNTRYAVFNLVEAEAQARVLRVSILSGSSPTAKAVADAMNAPYGIDVQYRKEAILIKVWRLPRPKGGQATARDDPGPSSGVGVDVTREIHLAEPLGGRAVINAGDAQGTVLPEVVQAAADARWNGLWRTREQRLNYVSASG